MLLLEALAVSGTYTSQAYAPFAVVTVKSGWPVMETRIVLPAANPLMARCRRDPASTDGGAVTAGFCCAACACAEVSPALKSIYPPSKFWRCVDPETNSSLVAMPNDPDGPPMVL